MTNEIHIAAERLADQFRALDLKASVSHSINRNGDASSYLEVEGFWFRMRVSDHFSGWTDAVDVFGRTAVELIEMREKWAVRSAQLREEEARVRTRIAAETAALKIAAQEAKVAAERSMGARRRAFFASAKIDFDALRGADRQAARDAFVAAIANGEA